jgi:diguanylate cyclase (GGDEF)-like protein
LAIVTTLVFAAGATSVWLSLAFRSDQILSRSWIIAIGLTYSVIAIGAFGSGRRLREGAVLAATAILIATIVIFGLGTSSAVIKVMDAAFLIAIAAFTTWFFHGLWPRVVLYSGFATYLTLVGIVGHPPRELTWAVATVLILAVTVTEVIAHLSSQLDRAARHDLLTGALNRRGLEEVIHGELRRAARQPGSFICLDLDDFKLVNDTLGHVEGDRVLVEAVQHWKTKLRPYDILGRLGGDEFIIVLPGSSAADAERVLSRIRATSPVRFSAGITTARHTDTVSTLLSRADTQLYGNKNLRRSADDGTAAGDKLQSATDNG